MGVLCPGMVTMVPVYENIFYSGTVCAIMNCRVVMFSCIANVK